VLLDSVVTKRPCRSRTYPEYRIEQEEHIMTVSVAGIDPHQDQFTVGIVDNNGVEMTAETFPNTAVGFVDAIDLLTTHRVQMVGVEGSASWGSHVAIALAAAGFDAREVPAQRPASQRRSRRLDKTDVVDSLSVGRALLAEPTLGPVQALEVYDPLVAKIEAVLEHRRSLVETRTLMLHYAADQIAKLPTEIRDQLSTTGKIESRLRRLETIDSSQVSTIAGEYRLSWLLPLIDQDRQARREIRRLERLIDELLDQHGTTLRDEPGIGPIAAATLLAEVGDPFRFARESKFALWCGTGAVALSSGEGDGDPVKHRLDFRGNRRINSVLYIASVTQQRDRQDARAYIDRKTAAGKTRREARRAHKRHLANRVIRRMWRDEQARTAALTAAA
jgi:transposase